MQKKIQSALISVFDKTGLEPVLQILSELKIKIYSTGGTRKFIEAHGHECTDVESLTGYPSILGGRVKTLHPVIFGGILARRSNEKDLEEMKEYHIPEIDLVIVDLYPFEKTVASTNEESVIIEKIDIGGPSMIRAAAKNFKDLLVIADKDDYSALTAMLRNENGSSGLEERKAFAAKAFNVCSRYDIAISNYFNHTSFPNPFSTTKRTLRYGENPHQRASFIGDLNELFTQLNGKELSYNNLVDVEAATQLMSEFNTADGITFAIIKHTNVCGIAQRSNVLDAFNAALAGDPESAFGGILIVNSKVDIATATALKNLFFEVLIAADFDEDALQELKTKKNRILLRLEKYADTKTVSKSLLNGLLVQDADTGNFTEWKEVGGAMSDDKQRQDLIFANMVCKHLKSNAIAIVKDLQLIGKGAGQTSRVDALRHAVQKAAQFSLDLHNAVVASDAFFPFDDCVKMGHEAGISAFIQPGGSIRDQDSIDYCCKHGLVMVMTERRHFRH
ncbi:MAG: bifunctional phosphoribosylaminoimidazolecarboxamide formyltransferase/IMP cyclohydrolase [Chitinophagaceae bacterium]|nr:bifunctional phosphoribosylaminoimidazolecarboxamide formyltransferase/IMP cyclohydrolase [Chitinophagaceae bacterium]